MNGGGDQHGGWRAPEGPTGPAGPPTAWPDGTPAGGPVAPVGPPAGGPPAAGPSGWSPPAWGPPPAPPGGTVPPGGSWRPPVPPPGPGARPSRGRSLLVGLGVLVAVAVVAAAVVAADPLGRRADEDAVGWREDATAEDLAPPEEDPPGERPVTTATTQPPTTTTAPPARLAPLPDPPAAPGPYAFLEQEDDGDPILWDPCETIQYVVNSRTAPPGGAEVLAEAMGQVSAATGLVFEDRGATDEPPTMELRAQTDPARYGEGWSPVLVAWTDPGEVADMSQAAGVGTPDWAPTGGGEYESVTGIVHLDGPEVAGWLSAGDRTTALHLMMHELGHLVGLDHVDDPRQVMYHNRDGRAEVDGAWNDGDRAGLIAAGSGDCDPTA